MISNASIPKWQIGSIRPPFPSNRYKSPLWIPSWSPLCTHFLPMITMCGYDDEMSGEKLPRSPGCLWRRDYLWACLKAPPKLPPWLIKYSSTYGSYGRRFKFNLEQSFTKKGFRTVCWANWREDQKALTSREWNWCAWRHIACFECVDTNGAPPITQHLGFNWVSVCREWCVQNINSYCY